jgi:hypothetical protein
MDPAIVEFTIVSRVGYAVADSVTRTPLCEHVHPTLRDASLCETAKKNADLRKREK